MFETPAVINDLIPLGFELAFYLIFLGFLIYTLFLSYHWFAYGTNRSTGMLALAVYLLGSMPFLLVMSLTF